MIGIEYNCRKIVSCGSRDNNLAGAGIDVSLSLFLGCIES